MQTIAEQVNAIIGDGMAAVTLAHGYAMDYSGKRYPFEPGRVISERRNAEGRCTSMLVSYSDGSTMAFKWSERKGASYTPGMGTPPNQVELCERIRLRDNVSTFHVVESGKLREVGEPRYRQLELSAKRTDTLFSTSDKQFRMQYKTVYVR